MKSDFLREMEARGFIYQSTDLDALDALMSKKSITAYIGFDATATSLHVGSLVPIMLLRWLQKTGHTPLVLLGGTTSKIGDPSFKDTERVMLDESVIQQNIQGISQVFSQFLDFETGENKALLVNNDTWLSQLSYIDFLRDFGRFFSVNRMLSFESVKARLDREQTLSFLEFNYMILQAYDFLELRKSHDCVLQMGGSDQWGNIINGVDLTRKALSKTVYGLTAPLIMTSSGKKMGKTEQGAVWLNADRVSPYDYWQFWRNTEDLDVGRYLRLFTELPLDEIARLEALQDSEINEAKKILADEATVLAHGSGCLDDIHKTIEKLFEAKSGGDLSSLPHVEKSRQDMDQGIPLVDLLCDLSFAASKGEARRLIKGGGARLNDTVVGDIDCRVTLEDAREGQIKLSAGKKRHGVVTIV